MTAQSEDRAAYSVGCRARAATGLDLLTLPSTTPSVIKKHVGQP